MTGELSTILRELKAGLGAIYGPRLLGLYLFGSRARGDAEEGSDIDVAMVLDGFESSGEERRRIGDLAWRLSLAHDCVVSCTPVRQADWVARRTMFLDSVRQEAVPVA
jgi:predicted nucleotidyltransferase